MTLEDGRPAAAEGPRPALRAARTRLGLVVALCLIAAVGWWWTAGQMRGMDAGPWTALGGFGWFVLLWVVMMAAMMFPSVAPTVALYARMTRGRTPLAPSAFTAGYLLVWTAAGVGAWVLGLAVSRLVGDALAWDAAGRVLAGGAIVVAGVYELTPLKDVCLSKCRSPLGFLLGSWRDGPVGGLRMGVGLGAWCLGCCWALMLALFALGVMSVVWMAFIAVLIAIEKTAPWRAVVTYGTAVLLVALGVLVLVDPTVVPGLTVPGMPTDMPPSAPVMPM
jgi:predicted metal-binding membrane protein